MGDWLNELHGYDARSTFISTLEHAAVKRELPNEPNVHALSFFIHFRVETDGPSNFTKRTQSQSRKL
jgi:hypothetical protein